MDEEMIKFIVNPSTEILEVLKKIDENSKGIVYVCDHDVLVGVITDGDVRRYILKENTVFGEAKDIMNKNPKYVYTNELFNSKKIMKKNSIKSLPVIDKKKRIIEILFFNKSNKTNKSLKVPVVIMAGGKGSRLYPYTQVLPKPLIPINDKTITELIMDNFESFDCSQFTMIVNYKKEFIKSFFAENEHQRNVKFIDEDTFMGTAGGLKLLEGKVNETFFMTNCDILIEDDYSKMIEYHKNKNNIITLVCALNTDIFPYGTVETNENGNVLALKEKPTFEFLTNTGLYIIEPIFLNYIPKNTFIHITNVIQNCIKEGLNVGVYPIRDESWMDMGQLEELEKMKVRINKKNEN